MCTKRTSSVTTSTTNNNRDPGRSSFSVAVCLGWPRFVVMLACAALLTNCATAPSDTPITNKINKGEGILIPDGALSSTVLPEVLDYTGTGTYQWPDGRIQSGHWASGQLQGIGSETTTRETYVGQWRNGLRHGHGEIDRADGSRYVGDFVDGQPHGKGTESADAGVYRGTWQAGKRHGQGQFNGADGSVYQGQWHNNLRQGFGQLKYANLNQYVGEWMADRPQGFGHMQYANSATFEGSWVAGQRQGYGSYRSTREIVYEGIWHADQRHGYGREKRPTGTEFSGQWRNDQRQGKGVETHADGARHSGLWSANEITGLGTRLTRAGIKLNGVWLDNTLSYGALNFPDGSTYTGTLFGDGGRKVAPSLIAWLQTQAAGRNAHAQLFLGQCFLDYDKPTRTLTTAEIWLKQAAEAGIAEAQFRAASIEITDNASAAITLLRQAAAQSHPIAHELLGNYYHVGQFLEQDIAKAISHYKIAIEKGSINAINNLAWLLATTEVDKFSKPKQAIELIRPMVLYLGHWQHLDTLAAAHARLGNTERAIRLQRQALKQIRDQAHLQVSEVQLDEMIQRLVLYQADKAYVE